MHVIKQIIRLQEGKHYTVTYLWCPFCKEDYTMTLNSATSMYRCECCRKKRQIKDLPVYYEDRFEHKHRETIGTMTERDAVDL